VICPSGKSLRGLSLAKFVIPDESNQRSDRSQRVISNSFVTIGNIPQCEQLIHSSLMLSAPCLKLI
jgi:hypothetical protein